MRFLAPKLRVQFFSQAVTVNIFVTRCAILLAAGILFFPTSFALAAPDRPAPADYEYQVKVFLSPQCLLVFQPLDNLAPTPESRRMEPFVISIEQFAGKLELIDVTARIGENADIISSGLRGATSAGLISLGTRVVSKFGRHRIEMLRKVYETRFRTRFSLFVLGAVAWSTIDYSVRSEKLDLDESEMPPQMRDFLIQVGELRPLLQQIKSELREIDFPRSSAENLGEIPDRCEFRELSIPENGLENGGLSALYLFRDM